MSGSPPEGGTSAAQATAALDTAAAGGGELRLLTGRDGSFSLWSERFREGFHSGRGALREAIETFLNPSQLERFPPGSTITVLEVCAGTGTNLAVLLEACRSRGLQLDWTGLELDPLPLRLALFQPAFRAAWQPQTLSSLEQLLQRSCWHGEAGERGRMLWGDARRTLAQLQRGGPWQLDLLWHDAFSPPRCPELWSVEFLGDLTRRLRPEGRWISYCSAAAVREALRLAGLLPMALVAQADAATRQPAWSGGTLASPMPLPPSRLWRELSPMERDHLASNAGEPYRDPGASASAAEIRLRRQRAQSESLASGRRGSSGAWRRQWGLAGPAGLRAEAR